MKNTFSSYTILFIVVSIVVPLSLAAQKNNVKDSATLRLLNNRTFTFIAEIASPMTGTSRHLTALYDVRIAGDSLVSDLPYFGRAYSAPLNSPGGINFTSTSFDMKLENRKKGGWTIIVNFKDQQDVRRFDFLVFGNGTATLNVTSNNRQPISFRGRVKRNE